MNPFKWPIYMQTLVAMCLGVFVGMIWGPEAAILGPYAKYLINLIKWVATPLLFFAILDAVISSEFRGKGIVWMFAVCGVNAVLAISIALTISNVFMPGSYMPRAVFPDPKLDAQAFSHGPQGSFLSALTHVIPSDKAGDLFSGTTAAIILSIGLGILLMLVKHLVGGSFDNPLVKIRKVVHSILLLHYRAINWLVHLIPIAVFCAIVKLVGTHGFSMMKGLLAYFLACSIGMILQVLLVYQSWIKIIAKRKLLPFWKEVKEAAIHSFGINSSLATLPITLSTLKRLKVSEGSARLAACVGTNFNNDGILLYEVVAALFMTQVYGWDLSFSGQIGLAMICVIATIGVAGIPEAGMISLSLVISAIGLPVEGLPLLLSVDWFLGRMRSVNNVLGDITGAIAIDACLGNKNPNRL